MNELRDYQNKAIEDIRFHFRRGKKRILLVAPTGSGKTIIACEMMSKTKEKYGFNLFVAHRRELIMQTSKKLAEFKMPHGVLMANKSPNAFASTQVASIQTFNARIDREDFIKPIATLIILDEAHRSISNSFKKLIEQYPEAFIVGLTATPIRADGKGLGGIYDELVECGSIRSLTNEGYLVKNRIVAPSIPDLQTIRIVAGDYDKGQLNKKMNNPKLVGDIVSHWVKHGENRPTVVFASSIAHSKYISNIFNHNGIPSGHIDGVMDEIERERQLQRLKNDEIKVLCNCMVLTEGWDEPKVSCVILARPTKSYGMYLQMIGRSLRPYPNKVDTLIIDHSGAVYEHGFPEDVPKWTLKPTSKKEKELKIIEKVEKQPLTCTQCFFVYKPVKDDSSCPNCSHQPTKKEKLLLVKEGRLVELPKIKPNSHDKENFYAQLSFYAKQKGFKEGWASWTFKKKYGHFPHSKRVFPVATGKDVIKFIQYCNIRNAKSKNMRELNV